MVKDAARKKAARAYQQAHPGMSYREAAQRSQAEYQARKSAETPRETTDE